VGDEITRRTLFSAIVGSLFGYTAAQELRPTEEQDLLAGAGGVAEQELRNLKHIVVGDDADSLLNELSTFPKLMIDSNGDMRILEEYGSGTEVLTLKNTGQLVIADSLSAAKSEIDQYPALALVRGEGATLIEQ